MRRVFWFVMGCALLAASVMPALAQTESSTAPDLSGVVLNEIASGFSRPLFLTHAGDGSDRLFVVEQGGRIWILGADGRLDTPFLDVSSLVSPAANAAGYTERGLLGLAFHPDYAQNGVFFIDYTDVNGNTVVARYHVSANNPDAADPASAEIILTQQQPFPNHNGGHLVFGPDGYLYIGFGDGGSQGDPNGNAQNLQSWLGKILRISVDVDGSYTSPADNPFASDSSAAPEIWAYGLRNPWRFSFDRDTGDFFIGDVGGSEWEEIDYQPAGSPGGANYGWNIYEGMHPTGSRPAPENMTLPIFEYSHSEGNTVTGGYVYRGDQISALQGIYLYGDFGFGTIWAAWRDEAGTWQSLKWMANTGYTISSFGEDEAGNLYIVNYAGLILRFDPAT
ncbi:MAG: PQQ-dependent sugar dehydrogenase [Anaerolineae bacterium]|nr:PQQ-dependent sugar dehydrogenase [Anaerolineae bacterium]